MNDFLSIFKDPVFVSIPATGGTVFHSKVLDKVLSMNEVDKTPVSGAYFTVNGFARFVEGENTGRTKNNVTSLNCNFLDIDLTPEKRRTEAEDIYTELCLKKMQPTAVVLTGKGLHVYWVYPKAISDLSPNKLKEYEALQTAIVSHYESRGADRQARDMARVLRVPDTFYYDKAGKCTCKTELLYFNPQTTYEPQKIAEYFKDSIKLDSDEGKRLISSVDSFDLSSMLNVKAGSRHHDSYSAALSLIQQAKDLTSARKLYQAVLSTWQPPLDWNDYWRQFENARQFIEKDRPQAFLNDPAKPAVSITMADDVEMKKIEWLWSGFIAKGKAHMLTGAPGLGKSQITIDIAARLSNGTAFPSYTVGEQTREPTGVLILSAEDDAADTMKPRLIAAGANLKNIGFISSAVVKKAKDGKVQAKALALREDAESILDAIALAPIKISLIIIDPVSAFLSSDQDSNSNSDARGTINQLQAVIMSKGIAMLMINHTNKNTSAKSAHMRSMGSVGWNAAARATFYVFPDEQEGQMVFSIGKMNLAKKEGHGFFYKIIEEQVDVAGDKVGVPRIEWNDKSFPTMDADEYSEKGDKPERKSSECESELELFMTGKAQIPSKEGMAYMKERGFSQAEVYRAARKQGIIGEYGIWKNI